MTIVDEPPRNRRPASFDISETIDPRDIQFLDDRIYDFNASRTGISDAKTEPKLTIEKEEDLWAAPKGNVSELKSRTVFSFTAAWLLVMRWREQW